LSGSGASLTYAPAANFVGSDSFTYTVNDGQLTSSPATVSITVTAVNDSPVAVAKSVSTAEDTSVPVVLSGVDPDGDGLTFAVVSGPSHGSLSGNGASLTYAPAANFVGSDSFTYTVNDGQLTSSPATVSITVTPRSTTANQLLVSDDSARRKNVRPLDGQTFRNGGPIYAFIGPQSKVGGITRVTFWIDDPARAGKPFSIENSQSFDLARTADNGSAYPLESNLFSVQQHTVTALVEYAREGSARRAHRHHHDRRHGDTPATGELSGRPNAGN
jgi:hypothetical protein